MDGDTLNVIVPARKMNTKSAGATKELALLLAAGRQAAGLEEATSTEDIRDLCLQFRRLDSPNFAGTLKEMDDVLILRGTPRKREVKVSRPGWEQATALVKRLANGGVS